MAGKRKPASAGRMTCRLSLRTLRQATPQEVRFAFAQAVSAYLHAPSQANSLNVDVALLALARLWRADRETAPLRPPRTTVSNPGEAT